ncbi:MAG: DMT family transporter, partial [Proteobacteria bacterium]|nr:DMT family transporter [Pseudomonadota bacterium]
MTAPGHGRAAGVAAALVAVSIWAGWIPVTRLGVVTRLSPADVAALRYVTASLVLLPALWLHRRELSWRPLPLLAVLAGAGVPYFLLFAYGLRLANSGQGGVMGPGATSVFAALLAWLVLGERPRRRRLAGLLVTAAGVAAVVLHDVLGGGGRVAGFALILAASCGWAAYTVASRALGLRPVLNAALVAVGNTALFLPAYLASGGPARL